MFGSLLAATRRRLCAVLEQGSASDRLSLAVNRGLIALIILTLVATVLESVPTLSREYGPGFYLIELTAVSVFSIEYAARAVGRIRARAVATLWACEIAAPVYEQRLRADRPCWNITSLACDLHGARIQDAAGVTLAAVPETDALLSSNALSNRSALY